MLMGRNSPRGDVVKTYFIDLEKSRAILTGDISSRVRDCSCFSGVLSGERMASRIRIGRWWNRIGRERARGNAWSRTWASWSQLADGCYLLRSNLTGVDAATLWKRYIQLTEAEWAFRIAKDELELRPIWHQKEDRVKAHILVCFLAYALWKTLAGWMKNARLGDAPRTLLEELAKLKSGDVTLTARSPANGHQRRIALRCVTEPDAAQAVLLHRLGLTLTLPRRLRRLDDIIQM